MRLGPPMSRTCESTPSSVPYCWIRSLAVFSPMPGIAGDVVGGVALQAVEVGDRLGRQAVAVDHRLAVIELGLGDAAGGGHHLHEPLLVDQLEDVAVAGDDRDRDARGARLL